MICLVFRIKIKYEKDGNFYISMKSKLYVIGLKLKCETFIKSEKGLSVGIIWMRVF